MGQTRTIQTVKQPYKTDDGVTLYMGTSTEVEVDANGKYIPGSAVISLRLYDTTNSLLGTDYKTVAIRNAGGAWNLTKDGNGNYVAGIDLQKTLASKSSQMNVNLNNHVSNALSAPLQGVPAGSTNKNNKASANAAIGAASIPSGTPTADFVNQNLTNPEQITVTVGKAVEMRTNYGNLYYPGTITRDQQDRVIFTMFKYAPAKINTGFSGQAITREIKESLGTVTLPIQPSISDSNSVDWSGGSINPIQAMAVGSALKAMNAQSPRQFLNAGLDFIQDAGVALSKNTAAANIYLAQEAVGVQNLLSRATGAILNPNLELLFNGPSLRPFAFTFRLSARDNTEATQIRQIIRFFKQGMAVRKTEQNIFLKAPNVFGIDYKTVIDGKLDFHPSLNRIKKCALIACDVDYTPDGTYMTFDDKARTITSYQISLRFSELEPIYQSDYSDKDGNAISPYNINSDEIGF